MLDSRWWAEGLDLVASGLEAGLNFEEAVRIGLKLDPGATWTQMMMIVEKKSRAAGLESIRPMMELAREAGGKPAFILKRGAQSIRRQAEWTEKYAALSLQAKGTAWIVGLSPVFFLTALGFLSPDLAGVMVTTRTGLALLGVMALLIVSGLLLVHRMARPRL